MTPSLISVTLAALAAVSNAGSSVMQRKAATAEEPRHHGGSLLWRQLHRGVWVGGFLFLILGFLLQATALSLGSVSVVQPVLAAELPLTLLIASRVFVGRGGGSGRSGMRGRDGGAAILMAVGLAVALFAASPTEGRPEAPLRWWAVAIGIVVVLLAGLVVVGLRAGGSRGAALLGVAAGGGFGLTAVFMATTTHRASDGVIALVSCWQFYAMIGMGVLSVVVLQHAYQAGVLAASQPGITIADPVVAVALGIALFDERIQGGWWIFPEVLGTAAVFVGAIVLSRSPLVTGEHDHVGRSAANEPSAACR